MVASIRILEKVEQPDVGFLVNQMEVLEQQPLGWQYQPAKDTRNKVSQIMTCFLLSAVKDRTTETARMGHRMVVHLWRCAMKTKA